MRWSVVGAANGTEELTRGGGMGATSQYPAQGGSAPPADIPALTPKKLALASLSSVLGGLVGVAFGGTTAMIFVGMAVSPWLTAFVEHPGPHRHRRVALVALLAFLIMGCRRALASVRGRRTSATTGAAQEARELCRVALTGAIAVAVAVLVITGGELAAGEAVAGDRDTTFFGGGGGSSAQGSGDRSSGRPSLRLPSRVVVTTSDLDGDRVTYHATAADDAGNALLPTCAPLSGTIFPIGDTRVRCTVTDAEGKRAEGGFVVTVKRGRVPRPQDTEPPMLSVPADFIRETETASDNGLIVTYLVTASDDRDGLLTPSCRPVSGSRFDLGRRRVTCSATDAAGRTSRASFMVTVVRADDSAAVDTTPPDIRVPHSIRRLATGPQGRQISYEASATDDRDGRLRPVCDSPSGSVFGIGTRTVRCTATNRAGLGASRGFSVQVIDGPPVLEISTPGRVPATSDKGARVTFTASATDVVDGDLQPVCDRRSGSIFPVGERKVRCTVKDSAGGTDEDTITVTVIETADTTAPQITGDKSATESSEDGESVRVDFNVTANDDRDGSVDVSCAPTNPGDRFPVGVTEVTCNAHDSAGNKASHHTVRVTVYNKNAEVE